MDRTLEETLYLMFTTRAFSTGVPTTLGGTPVVSAYENENLTQITAGITLGTNHDGVTGLNLLTVVAAAASGYEAGKDYNLVITTGTVGGVSVVGECVGRFSLSREAAAVDLANATDGLGALKTLIDTVDNFIDTEIADILTDTSTTLDDFIDTEIATIITDIAAVKADTAAILVDTGTDGVALANGAITAAKFGAGAIDAAALNADAVDEIWDETIGDGAITARGAQRVLVASQGGKLSGAATTTVTIRNVADTANVVVATVDADGNRSATTVTP